MLLGLSLAGIAGGVGFGLFCYWRVMRIKRQEASRRIQTHSPLGKPLYIDVRECMDSAAERLQERFRASTQTTTFAYSSSSS
jgi:hypothetical protein